MVTSPSRTRAPLPWAPLLLGVALLGALYSVFFVAETEARMGDVYRVFYFHVSSAITMQTLFFIASVLSGAYLVMRRIDGFRLLADKSDRVAWAMAEVGVMLGIVVLTTGPIWAKPAWGAYWTWEPRLTLALLTVFLYVGYLVLRGYGGSDGVSRRLSAGIALIGAPATYFVRKAVEWWGGNHPQVITGEGGGLAEPGMQLAFGVTIAAVAAFAIYLVTLRTSHHAMRDALDGLFLDASDLPTATLSSATSPKERRP